MNTTDLGSLPFPEAASAWLESRKDFLGKSTYRDYVVYVRTLGKFFGSTARLDTFTADDIRRYQHSRLEKAIGSSINKETSILQQLLKRAGRWSEIGHDYQPLPTSKELRGRALTDAERVRLFAVASSSPTRQATYLFAVISARSQLGCWGIAIALVLDIAWSQSDNKIRHFLYRKCTHRSGTSDRFGSISDPIIHKIQGWHGSCLFTRGQKSVRLIRKGRGPCKIRKSGWNSVNKLPMNKTPRS
jgi:hypothetical protein